MNHIKNDTIACSRACHVPLLTSGRCTIKWGMNRCPARVSPSVLALAPVVSLFILLSITLARAQPTLITQTNGAINQGNTANGWLIDWSGSASPAVGTPAISGSTTGPNASIVLSATGYIRVTSAASPNNNIPGILLIAQGANADTTIFFTGTINSVSANNNAGAGITAYNLNTTGGRNIYINIGAGSLIQGARGVVENVYAPGASMTLVNAGVISASSAMMSAKPSMNPISRSTLVYSLMCLDV